jgi:hypothetical protein
VKGKDIPVPVCESLDIKSVLLAETIDELRLYRGAFKLQHNQQFNLSEIQFINLKNRHPQKFLYALYIK